jgi:bifunctional non-homologous end joining protein LigD
LAAYDCRATPAARSLIRTDGDRQPYAGLPATSARNESGDTFSLLQRGRPQSRRPTTQLLRQVPTRFYAFDVLEFEGRDITGRPYIHRREMPNAIAGDSESRTVQLPCNWQETYPAL